MKTLTTTILISIFFSLIVKANGFKLNEETYIDDIPFNTELIAKEAIYEAATHKEFQIEEEAYIDDIPFDTHEVCANHRANTAMSVTFEMPEEAFIDDIPFNTMKIAFRARLREVILSSNI